MASVDSAAIFPAATLCRMTGPVPDPGWRNKSFGELAMGRASEGDVPLRIGPTCPFARPVDRAATELAVLVRPVESEVTPVEREVTVLAVLTSPVERDAIELVLVVTVLEIDATTLPVELSPVESDATELPAALSPVESEAADPPETGVLLANWETLVESETTELVVTSNPVDSDLICVSVVDATLNSWLPFTASVEVAEI